MRSNATQEDFELITLFGRPALFSILRIDRATVPEGFYMYEVRHDDDCQGDPVEIAEWIFVNFWGTVITTFPIDLNVVEGKKPCRFIDPEGEDWGYEGEIFTISKYLAAFPPETAI